MIIIITLDQSRFDAVVWSVKFLLLFFYRTNISAVCQSRGQCECGQCVCGPINSQEPTKRYSGTYCECNDHSCDYSRTDSGQSEICGGEQRKVQGYLVPLPLCNDLCAMPLCNDFL